MVELALLVPLFVIVLLFGGYLTDLALARLKLQEAARFSAWEMTSHTLTDFGGTDSSRHGLAFDFARNDTRLRAKQRYAGLDSISSRRAVGPFTEPLAFDVAISDGQGPAFAEPIDAPPSTLAPGFQLGIMAAASAGTAAVLEAWGFSSRGQVEAEVSVDLHNLLLPRRFLDGPGGLFQTDGWGGSQLARVRLTNRFVLLASAWDLTDGSDAVLDHRQRLAGARRYGDEHGLHRQVDRMTFLGMGRDTDSLPWWRALRRLPVVASLPDPFGTFVVSHNYGLTQARANRRCPAGAPGHPEPDGLSVFEDGRTIDHDRPVCFDTAPFRDDHQYDASLYIQMFRARGSYFMGCQNAMADDPTEPSVSALLAGDFNQQRIACEGGAP